MLQQHSSGLARMTVNQRIPCTDKNITRAPAGTAGALLICLEGTSQMPAQLCRLSFCLLCGFPVEPEAQCFRLLETTAACRLPPGFRFAQREEPRLFGLRDFRCFLRRSASTFPWTFPRSAQTQAQQRCRIGPHPFPCVGGLVLCVPYASFFMGGRPFHAIPPPTRAETLRCRVFQTCFPASRRENAALLRLSAQRPAAMIRHSQRQPKDGCRCLSRVRAGGRSFALRNMNKP